MNDRLTQDLVLNALQQTPGRRKREPGMIFHSDRGSEYAGHAFRNVLKDHNLVQCMSDKSNCNDNAVMERSYILNNTEPGLRPGRVSLNTSKTSIIISGGILLCNISHSG
jgi:transposase InsO family protein